jgi:hypothetical protein
MDEKDEPLTMLDGIVGQLLTARELMLACFCVPWRYGCYSA